MTIEEMRRTLRVTTDAFDDDINALKEAAIKDLELTGIVIPEEEDKLVDRAILTYLRMYFGPLEPSVWEKLKSAYDEQKAQLLTAHDKYREDDD